MAQALALFVGDNSVLEPKSSNLTPDCALLRGGSVQYLARGYPMDAYLTETQSAFSPFALPPVLIAAQSDAGRRRAIETIEAVGLRFAECADLDAAPERIALQAAAAALWVELDHDRQDTLDRLLDRVQADVGGGRYGAIIAAPSSLLDLVSAKAWDTNIEVLIDATESERIASLALATSVARRAEGVSDVAADRNAARLRQLSDEVSRIASTLARLSTGPRPANRVQIRPELGDLPELPAETVRAVIRARRLRGRFFSEELFADPAWDMLLDLLQAEIAQLRVPVSSLCIAAAVPATTALRWLKTMTEQGLFVRRADPHDGRRVFVELAPTTSQALRRYFAEVGHVAVV